MSRGMPSMVALLGLLAVAGYQNRDKIADALGGLKGGASGEPGKSTPQEGQGGLLGNLGGLLSGGSAGSAGSAGSVLSGGLRDLVERFKANGHGKAAESWVSAGPNQPLHPEQLEQALGPDVLNTLAQQTGLSRDELLSRLTHQLPSAVDKLTPEGRLPTEDEAGRLI
ncbi:MAG: YidB family protein [Casimicrobiaceae bacterium]